MHWTVHTLNPEVEAEIKALPADMQARYLRLADLTQAHGLDRIGAPHVKHLEGRLWELRITGRDGIARAICHHSRPSGGDPACLREEDPEDTTASAGNGQKTTEGT